MQIIIVIEKVEGFAMMSLRNYIFVRNCIKSDTKRDEGLTTPDDIERIDNIVYGTDSKWQIMDIYKPKNMLNGMLPVIVSSHGGGWVYGNKEVYQFYCMNLAQRGFVVVNYTYRLAPKFKYPAAMEDTNLVFNWIMDNGEKYGMDLNNIFGVGDSAGAQIIGLYSAMITNKAYGDTYSFSYPEGLTIRALGMNCGKYDTLNDEASGFFKDLLPKKGTLEEKKMISVVEHITKDFPPCYILTANQDFLKDEPKSLIKALNDNGIEHEFKLYGSDDNPLYHVFHCNIKSEDAKQANDDECQFFRKHLKGGN